MSRSEKIRYYARKEVKKAREDFEIEELRGLGKEYLKGLEGKKIVLLGEKKDSEKRCCVFLDYNSLLHEKYVKRLLRKFHKLDNQRGVGITLTLHCSDKRSVFEDLKKIKSCWNVLRLELRRRYKNWGGNYFTIVEMGKKRGMVHLHNILYGLRYVNQKWLSERWYKITKDSYVVWCSKAHHPKKATTYIYKYLWKSIKKSGKVLDGVLMVWGSGLRLWGCSRGLFELLKNNENVGEAGWEWSVYLFNTISIVRYCGIILSDIEGYYEIDPG